VLWHFDELSEFARNDRWASTRLPIGAFASIWTPRRLPVHPGERFIAPVQLSVSRPSRFRASWRGVGEPVMSDRSAHGSRPAFIERSARATLARQCQSLRETGEPAIHAYRSGSGRTCRASSAPNTASAAAIYGIPGCLDIDSEPQAALLPPW